MTKGQRYNIADTMLYIDTDYTLFRIHLNWTFPWLYV